MLRHDPEIAGVDRLRGLGDDLDRGLVDGRDRLDVVDDATARHRELRVGHHGVVGPGHIRRGQRLPIRPLEVRPEGIGPGGVLGGPLLRQVAAADAIRRRLDDEGFVLDLSEVDGRLVQQDEGVHRVDYPSASNGNSKDVI